MRIVLIGDIHSYRLFVPPWGLVGKRLIGQANLWLNRRHHFDHGLVDETVQQVIEVKPDLVLFSGDLTTTALDKEFEDVAKQLVPLTTRFATLIVPGNHDRYTFTSARQRTMESVMPDLVPNYWPHFRTLTDHWHLLALDSAVPRIFNSRGLVGRHQLQQARRLISPLTTDDGLVVLCHYPLKSPPRALPLTWDHKLADSFRLRRMLIRCSARVLYLHGHIHRPWCWQPKRSNQSHFTYINAGSPCMTSTRYPRGQGFWQIDLPKVSTDHMQVVHHVPVTRGCQPIAMEVVSDHEWFARKVL